jgi:hypothetical protein
MKRPAVLVALFVLAACASGPPRDVPAGPALGRFTDAEVVEHAKALTTAAGIPEDRRSNLLTDLDKLLADPAFQASVKDKGISGVCAYSSGSGGFVIAGGSAKGVASFAGGGSTVPFEGSNVAVGAVIGGQAAWGIGLLIGLAHEAWFPGEYDGNVTSSTAAAASTGGASLTSEWHGHTVRTVSTGVGLAANAGHIDVTISWKK